MQGRKKGRGWVGHEVRYLILCNDLHATVTKFRAQRRSGAQTDAKWHVCSSDKPVGHAQFHWTEAEEGGLQGERPEAQDTQSDLVSKRKATTDEGRQMQVSARSVGELQYKQLRAPPCGRGGGPQACRTLVRLRGSGRRVFRARLLCVVKVGGGGGAQHEQLGLLAESRVGQLAQEALEHLRARRQRKERGLERRWEG
eukprot:6196031-Pleurochrysis_carterae.AAC.2